MLTWPDASLVDRAVRAWAAQAACGRDDVVRIGYCGSYARGDWGPGSDVDVVIVVRHSARPFWARAREWDVTALPVPADLFVYTEAEWGARAAAARPRGALGTQVVWVYSA